MRLEVHIVSFNSPSVSLRSPRTKRRAVGGRQPPQFRPFIAFEFNLINREGLRAGLVFRENYESGRQSKEIRKHGERAGWPPQKCRPPRWHGVVYF